ncbi:MAG: protein phosphatase 2C domain-containing protein [Deinococcus sp.]|nr:protein phosphatase 2C domain-containing protein [Deinococcus sp.]
MLDSGHTEPVSVAYLTDPGRREANQDAVGYQITPSGGVFIVADGMGGHRTGELASKLAVDTIQAQLRVGQPSPQQLVEAYERANQEVYSYGQRPESRGMGTTATTLLLDLPYALVAHVGDSRAYLFRGGELLQLTDDHSWVADRMRQGLLSPEEARHHRWRNVITNALGSFPEVKVDISALKVAPGDVFLLCSDGVTSVLDDKVLLEVLKKSGPSATASELVKLANAWGGPDNISVMVVAVGGQVPAGQRSYALPLEGAAGPIRLSISDAPETLNAGLPGQTGEENPPGRARTGDRLGLVLLLLLWLALLAYVLYNQYGQNGIPIQPFR